MRVTAIRTAVGLCLTAGLLAACQTGEPVEEGATTEPSADVSASATAAPTPSATPSAPADDEAGEASGVPVADGTLVLSAPLPGAVVAGPVVTLAGEGTAFEGTLTYVVTGADGAVAAEGFVQAGANGEVGPFAVDVELAPGSYTVRVEEPDVSDGEGTPGPSVEAAFTVS